MLEAPFQRHFSLAVFPEHFLNLKKNFNFKTKIELEVILNHLLQFSNSSSSELKISSLFEIKGTLVGVLISHSAFFLDVSL